MSPARLFSKILPPTACALALSLLLLCGGQAGANGAQAGLRTVLLEDPSQVGKVRVTLHRSQTVRASRAFSEVLLAAPEIADVVPLTTDTLYIVGKKIGMTRLTVLDANKRLMGVVEIEVSFDVAGLAEELERAVPDGHFKLGTANGRILLRGSVPDAVALSKAVSITEQFTAGCEAEMVRELVGAASAGGGQPPPAAAATAVAGAQSASGGQRAGNGAALAGGGLDRPSHPPKCFVNALTVRAPQQVLLEVRFVEAQRIAARELGFSWDASANRIRGITGASTIPILGPTAPLLGGGALGSIAHDFATNNVPFGTFVARVLDTGTKADVLIQALEKQGLVRRLAEPNLVTLSGDTANFLAGGEFPFPVAQNTSAGAATITLEFKKFGVGLAFTPTVLAHGQINLKIEPEVSDLDPTRSFPVGAGLTVPALIVRRANTTVELRDGQSFAIAGLIQSIHKKDTDQLPWLGEVPVLGALFRSASYTKEESDLVIIVTPHLVRPAVPGQRLLTPLDQKVAGNDRDYFLRGRREIPRHFTAPYGHILEPGPGFASVISKETTHGSSK